MAFVERGTLHSAGADGAPGRSRREIASDIEQLAADGLSLQEIRRVLGLRRERVLKLAVQFRIRIRPHGSRPG